MFAESLYRKACTRSTPSFKQMHKRALCISSEFLALKDAPQAPAPSSVAVGSVGQKLLSSLYSGGSMRVVTLFARCMIEAIEKDNGGHYRLLEIIEANPLLPREDIQDYTQSLVGEYGVVDEVAAIAFIKHRVLARWTTIEAQGFMPEILDNYMAFLFRTYQDLNAAEQKGPATSDPASKLWEQVDVRVPLARDDEPVVREQLLPERFLQRLFLFADFMSKTEPILGLCCDFLARLPRHAIWDSFKRSKDIFFTVADFLEFVELVYLDEIAQDPEGAVRALQGTLPGQEIKPEEDFFDIIDSNSHYHIWNWAQYE